MGKCEYNVANKMCICICSLLLLIVSNAHSTSESQSYGTCTNKFHIEKHTVSSSNSKRDYDNIYKIFPYLNDQYAPKFKDGLCGHQMKVELPFTCFKLHAPETWQRDSGLLSIQTFEKEYSKKWQSVVSNDHNTFNYDIFLDFNMAFWVESLNPYINKWTDYDFEYLGILWYSQLFDSQFYSILIHLPDSSITYEFMSQSKPSNEYYNNLKWINSNIPRATFQSMNPYPWNRMDNATIVPVRLSQATSDILSIYDFYVNVMESNVLEESVGNIIDDLNGDNINTKYVFVSPLDTQIELLFIERSIGYTFGEFTLLKYENLLLETHDSIVTTPFCGIDRWMDNHYGFTTWNVDGYLDRILYKLQLIGMKYRIYKVDKTVDNYIFFVFQPNGQSIQLMGTFVNTVFYVKVPNWDPQWCYRSCPGGMMEGMVDKTHIYYEDDNSNWLALFNNNKDIVVKDNEAFVLSFKLVIGICGFCSSICFLFYGYRKCKRCKEMQDLVMNNDVTSPLIHRYRSTETNCSI